jgi:hypothetical protein
MRRGDFRDCDPRRPHITTGADRAWHMSPNCIRTRRGGERQREHEPRPFSRLATRDFGRAVPAARIERRARLIPRSSAASQSFRIDDTVYANSPRSAIARPCVALLPSVQIGRERLRHVRRCRVDPRTDATLEVDGSSARSRLAVWIATAVSYDPSRVTSGRSFADETSRRAYLSAL